MEDLLVSKCGQILHDVRNGLLCISSHVRQLENLLPVNSDIIGIQNQIRRVEQSIKECQNEGT